MNSTFILTENERQLVLLVRTLVAHDTIQLWVNDNGTKWDILVDRRTKYVVDLLKGTKTTLDKTKDMFNNESK